MPFPSGIHEEKQLKALHAMKELASYMYCPTKNGGLARKPFMTGIIVSVNSTLDLYFETKREGLRYQLTTRENQDSLENLFSNLRAMGGGNSHPSPVETANRIRKLCVYKNVSFVLDSANVAQSDQGFMTVLLNLFFFIFNLDSYLSPHYG